MNRNAHMTKSERRELREIFKKKRLYLVPFGKMKRFTPFFPTPRGKPRVNDWVTISGIIHVQINGMPWHQAPEEYGPYMTLYNRWKRWCDKGIFVRILQELGLGSRKTDTLLLDSTCIKAHRVACSMTLRPGEHGRKIGRTSGGLNCKLHLVTDAAGRPILMSLTAGQVSDYKGARALSGALPKAKALVADRGYDANWFRNLLKKRKLTPAFHRDAIEKSRFLTTRKYISYTYYTLYEIILCKLPCIVSKDNGTY